MQDLSNTSVYSVENDSNYVNNDPAYSTLNDFPLSRGIATFVSKTTPCRNPFLTSPST